MTTFSSLRVLVGVGVVALAEQAAMSLLPVWALAQGHTTRLASIMLVVMTAGSVVLTFVVGWLADRVSRPLLMVACATATAAAATGLALTGGSRTTVWPVLFVFGGAYYAIYVLSLIRLGQRFSGALLVEGNAAFGAIWGIGGIAGPPLLGGVMSRTSPSAFPYALAAVFATVAVFFAASRRRSRRGGAAQI